MNMSNCMYYDSETLSLNPYHPEHKMITAQIGYSVNGEFESHVFKEWELGEKTLIDSVLNNFENLTKYTNVYTYNGLFDILYLLGRCVVLGKSFEELDDIASIFTSHIKHCDLFQYDNGYLVSLDKICDRYKIPSKCIYKGKDIARLYSEKEYDKIVSHGEDDIERLHALITNTSLANRFTRMSIYD